MAGYSPASILGSTFSTSIMVENLRETRRFYRDDLKATRLRLEKQKKQFEEQETRLLDDIQKLEDALDILAKPYLTSEEVAKVFSTYLETRPKIF